MSGRLASLRNRFSSVVADSDRPDPIVDDQVVLDEALLMRLQRLAIMFDRAMTQGISGEHRSRRRGASPEFADFKSYSQGDDFRRIDWNIYSRLGELFVRLSEITTESTVHILLDASRSMQWRGDPSLVSKFTYARRVAGAFGYIGLWHFDRLTITPFASELGYPFGPSHGRAHITPMFRYLTDLRAAGETSIAESIERYVRARKQPGSLIVISDLLSGEPNELQPVFRLLRSRGWQTIVVQIVDPVEREPARTLRTGSDDRISTIELVDLETSDRLRVVPNPAVLDAYDRAYRIWQDQIDTICALERVQSVVLETDLPFETVVLDLLARRGIVG